MQETSLMIKIFGEPVLRKKSAPVREVEDRHRELLREMAVLMYDGGGIGLAAPQVGINEQLIVADIGGALYKLINPIIVKRQGRQVLEEGCLSVPGVCIKVPRALKIQVKFLNEEGQRQSVEAQGLLACVFQHEIDHLKGRLIVDYASFLQRLKIRKKLEELSRRASHEKLSQSEAKSCKLQL